MPASCPGAPWEAGGERREDELDLKATLVLISEAQGPSKKWNNKHLTGGGSEVWDGRSPGEAALVRARKALLVNLSPPVKPEGGSVGYRGSLPFLLCTPSPASPSSFPSPAGGREMRGGGGSCSFLQSCGSCSGLTPLLLGFLGEAWGKPNKQK